MVPLLKFGLEQMEVKQLSQGYDVGCGFVIGEEEICGRIEHMSDRADIVEELRKHCITAKMDMIKCLGMLHYERKLNLMKMCKHSKKKSHFNQLINQSINQSCLFSNKM